MLPIYHPVASILVSSTKTQDQVKSGLLLDVVITEGTSILELLPGKDETLLVRRNSFLVLDLGLYVVDGIGWFHIKSNGLSGQSLHENLHSSAKTEDQVKGGFLLDLGLHIVDGIGWFHIKSDGLSGQRLHEDLHSTTKAKDQVKSGFLLDVIIAEGASILKLFS